MPIVILGTDALLAAAPATAVQLAHACLRGGYTNVIPASWGDELIAAAVLRTLPEFDSGPAIQCSCPVVAHRLLNVGPDLRPVLLPLVPPPVAIARYIRTLAHPNPVRITYVGRCAGAVDDSIDIRMTPLALFELLAERDILLEEQPLVFDSILPYDRRRYRSQPGGLPTADALESGGHTVIEVHGDDFVAEIAQHLLSGKSVLIDAAAALGCVCSGAIDGVQAHEARQRVISLEPPRAPAAIIADEPVLDLDLQLPAVTRTAIDVMVGARSGTARANAVRRGGAIEMDARGERPGVAAPHRGVLAATPAARHTDGKALPRAYVARRRLTPRSLPVVQDIPDESDGLAPQTPADAESR